MSWIRLHPSLALGIGFYEVGSPFVGQRANQYRFAPRATIGLEFKRLLP